MGEIDEVFNNNLSYPTASFVSQWINISVARTVVFTAYSDVNFDITIDSAIDNQFQIIESVVYTGIATEAREIFLQVKTRFMRFTVNLTSPPAILRTQGFFWVNSSQGLTNLENGPGESLFENPIIKSLSEGTGINLISTADNIEIISLAPYQEITPGNITPASLDTSAVISGNNNAIDTSQRSLIGGSTDSIISGVGINNVVLASNNCDIITTSNTAQQVICGSSLSKIYPNAIGAPVGCGIYTCYNCEIRGISGLTSGNGSVCIAALNSGIGGNSLPIVGGVSGSYCSIIGGDECFITDSSSLSGVFCSTRGKIEDICLRCVIMGGEDSLITTSRENSTIIGSNTIIQNSGCFHFSDSAGGSVMTSNGNYQCNFRASGGMKIYTNTTNTTGMTMGAGLSAWSVVSDINAKENIELLNYSEIMDKVDSLNFYRYNYIGNNPKIVDCNTMAQEWHTQFPSELTEDLDDDTGIQKIDEQTGDPLFKPAKDPLTISQGDQITMLYCCVKDLSARVKYLESLQS
jgi:hypothetical protein